MNGSSPSMMLTWSMADQGSSPAKRANDFGHPVFGQQYKATQLAGRRRLPLFDSVLRFEGLARLWKDDRAEANGVSARRLRTFDPKETTVHLKRPSEPRLEPIPKVMEKARKAMEGQSVKPVNVLATLSHNRVIRDAVNQMSQTMLFGSELPRRQVEMAILRIGWNCQSVYEFGQHTLFGLDAGLSDEEIYFITRPIEQGAWSPADAAILQLVDDLYSDDCVADATWAEASQHFSEADIIHFIATAGCYRLVSGFLNSTGVELDEGVPGWPEPSGDRKK